jgi:aryl-alcohol dehydrogenase-like predicted oxidoreductase
LPDIEYHRNRYIKQVLDDILALQQHKSQGKIRFFGVTAHSGAVLKVFAIFAIFARCIEDARRSEP